MCTGKNRQNGFKPMKNHRHQSRAIHYKFWAFDKFLTDLLNVKGHGPDMDQIRQMISKKKMDINRLHPDFVQFPSHSPIR